MEIENKNFSGDEDKIKHHFTHNWTEVDTDEHVVKQIRNAKNVIDVGCGTNLYKKHCGGSLFGIDIVNEGADWIGDFHNWEDMDWNNKYDVAICFGILHFNSYEWIRKGLEWVLERTTDDAKILMKVNPANIETPVTKTCGVVWFDRWNLGLIDHFADIYNLEVENFRIWDHPVLQNSQRLKFDYKKRR